LREVQSEMRALRRDVDDLDESFRRFRGRIAKQRALDEPQADDSEAAAPANGGAATRRSPPKLASVADLRARGRWPFAG
jgi:hypothetical protein